MSFERVVEVHQSIHTIAYSSKLKYKNILYWEKRGIKQGFIGTNAISFRNKIGLRKADHYESYNKVDWQVQWQLEGDSLACYLE